MSKVILDTSALMQFEDSKLDALLKDNEIILLSIVAVELDHNKESDNNQKAYKARKGLRWVKNNELSLHYAVTDEGDRNITSSNDTIIVDYAEELGASIATADRGMWIRAKSRGIEVIGADDDGGNGRYTGIMYVDLDEGKDDDMRMLSYFLENPTVNVFGLLENQYISFKGMGKDFEMVYRWKKGKIEKVKFHSIKDFSGTLRPKNVEQMCALDLLFDPDVPIVVIEGVAGSGKNLLTVKTGVHLTRDKGVYDKINYRRNYVNSAEKIGFLPGEKRSKISDLLIPLIAHLPNKEVEAERMMQLEQLTLDVVAFAKGQEFIGYNIIDECQDIGGQAVVKMVGERLGDKSKMVFIGSYKQAEKQYKAENVIEIMINAFKGRPEFGTIYMPENLRSGASRLFTELL